MENVKISRRDRTRGFETQFIRVTILFLPKCNEVVTYAIVLFLDYSVLIPDYAENCEIFFLSPSRF